MAKAITDEPGIYLEGKFGVRIENTLIITPYKETEFGKFLQFESLTLCPIDKTPIIKDMLLQEEIDWLNAYHQRVFKSREHEKVAATSQCDNHWRKLIPSLISLRVQYTLTLKPLYPNTKGCLVLG